MQGKRIGLVCWWSNNYGNAATNYALFCFLKKNGYSVLMVDNMKHEKLLPEIQGFNKCKYELSSSKYEENILEPLNWECDCFIVGSDQLWNYEYSAEFGYGTYYRLDFADKYKNKISYAASFGKGIDTSPDAILLSQIFLLKRFDHISVREESGVKILSTRYGIEGKQVVDPVFLCDKEDYMNLIMESDKKTEDRYLLLYVLDPDIDKIDLAKRVAEKYQLKIFTILDMDLSVDIDKYDQKLYVNLLSGLDLQDWLKYIYNASFVITDSFHGTCFCTIFNKRFLAIINRQSERFDIFKKNNKLSKYIISKEMIKNLDLKEFSDLDYKENNLSESIFESQKWLLEAIEKQHICKDNVLLEDDLRKNKSADIWNREVNDSVEPIREKADFFEKQYNSLLEANEWLTEQKKEQEKFISELMEANKWLTEQKNEHEKYIDELLEGNRWLASLKEEHERYIKELENGK